MQLAEEVGETHYNVIFISFLVQFPTSPQSRPNLRKARRKGPIGSDDRFKIDPRPASRCVF